MFGFRMYTIEQRNITYKSFDTLPTTRSIGTIVVEIINIKNDFSL